MARISFDDELLDETELEDFRPKRKKRRRRRKKISLKARCCLWFLILLIFFLIIITAFIAKAGVVQIPFFSQIFYRLAQPSRQIEIDNQELVNIIQQGLNLEFDPQGLATIEITEEELTYLFRQSLSGKDDSYFAESLQLIISKDRIEFFGLLIKPISASITLIIKPYLVNNILDFELIQAKIGDLSPPPKFTNWLIDTFLGDKLTEINQEIGGMGQLQSLELKEGKLIITLKPNLDLEP
jgi:hypothetical protein